METKCAECGCTINRKPSRIKNRNYCNGKCQMRYEYQNGIRDRFKTGEKAREAVREKSRKKFKDNPTTKIGKRGYKLIYLPLVGWKYYHHYIWEKHYKEKIEKGYCIHHIDGNPLNNKISNLMKLTIRDHAKLKKKVLQYENL